MNKKMTIGRSIGVFDYDNFQSYMRSRFPMSEKIMESRGSGSMMLDYAIKHYDVRLIYERRDDYGSEVSLFLSGDNDGVNNIEKILSEVKDCRV